jgi:uncharacterized RDD family membrane protein YckC
METVLDQVCASCGNARHAYDRYCLFCGDLLSEPTAKVVVSSKVANPPDISGTPSQAAREYAGFWRRFWAGIIDLVLEAAAALGVTYVIDQVLDRVGGMLGYERSISKFASGMAFILVLAIGSWLYAAFAESSPRRATIGKRLMGIQVVTGMGGQLYFGQATVRHFMKFLSLFLAGVGFMMAGWTKRRQALHDIPLDCIVVKGPQGKPISLLSP